MRRDRASGVVTVLFTDLVQSTDLMSRLGETVFDEVRRAHFAALRQAVARYGGEEVKTVGDGEMAIFGSVADAFRCAIAMQQATDRQAGSGPAPVAIRVGVSVGEVTFEGGDVFGTPVVEAARLVALARPGQILTTTVARAVAGVRAGVEFSDIGPVELKGLPAPVPACEILWQPLPEPNVPVPAFLSAMGGIFVGRQRELEQLRKLWKEAGAGEVRIVFLAGEPGVGKTRLAAELVREAHDQGATVLAGCCDEDLGVPYQPFVEALRHLLDHTPDREVTRRLGRHPGDLTRLIPELGTRLPGLAKPLRADPETERYRLFDAVAAWLTAVSHDQPLLLVLDDLQWAAKPTLLLLRHLARGAGRAKLLVVGTYRDTELGRTHPLSELLAALRRTPGLQRISLSGLDSSAVTALMTQAAGHNLDDDDLALARAIHHETEGNPLFVREVLRHLAETGATHGRNGRSVTGLAVGQIAIPDGVRDVVARRVSRLSEVTNRALSAAAVAGLEFELEVVEQAAGIPPDHLVVALEEAVAARLLIETPGRVVRYRFTHALVRDTLYDELSAARRVRLHRRVAETIGDLHAGRLDDHLPALAHHYARAASTPAGTDKAVEYAARAGARALAQLAHDEAVVYYRQALALLGGESRDETKRLELLLLLGEAQRRAGAPAHRQTLLDAARLAQQQGDGAALARAALANNRGYFSIIFEVDAERVAVLEAALEGVGPSDSGVRARLLANLAAELVFAPNGERLQQVATEALAMARRLGDPTVLGHVLATRYAVLVPTALEELDEYITELDALAATLNSPGLAVWAAACGGPLALIAGDLTGFEARLGALEGYAAELAQPSLRWIVTFLKSNQARNAGHLPAAEALAQEALEIGTAAGVPDAVWAFGVNLFGIRYDQGRLGDLFDLLQRAVKQEYPFAEAAFALSLCELDRHDEARPVFEVLAADGFARIPRNFAWLYGLTMAAESCAALGKVEQASVLYDILAPHHALVATAGSVATGSVAHSLGMLATTVNRYPAAEGHFIAAAETHARMQAPVWLARTRLEWARMLLTRRQPGDVERARELLGQALTTARQLDLGTVERRAVALLR